ncbi:hypothetical protein DZC30_20420 [Comamonas testosteroni]|uniref:Uncharacterized protein n=1 Tax=Comamonas testosteroni TaxID=285 RepID=A0A373F8U4_COMTE|nr:hypothetical protein DZC30_20420 [Comamonas testosteroni]
MNTMDGLHHLKTFLQRFDLSSCLSQADELLTEEVTYCSKLIDIFLNQLEKIVIQMFWLTRSERRI